MTTSRVNIWSERVWPIVRVLMVQLLLMTGIVGNLVGWLVLALLVDRLHWFEIDFHGKTLNTISPDGKVLGFCILFIVNLIILILAWKKIEHKSFVGMLWEFSPKLWKPLGYGLFAGLIEAVIIFATLSVLGVTRSQWGLTAISPLKFALFLGWLIASSILGPVAEEFLYRGYWFQNVQKGCGVAAAVVVTSVIFGSLHLLNPNAELLGAVNISLSALAFALGMLWFRSLWFPIGWHAAWNFAQFFVFGLPNSGISVASMGLEGATILTTTVSGPNWITGGAFGMEASLIKTIVLLLVLIVWYQFRKRAQILSH